MNRIPLVYYYSFEKLKPDALEKAFAEFKKAGAYNVAATNKTLERFLSDSDFLNFFIRLRDKYSLSVPECHGLWGGQYDIFADERELRDQAVALHAEAMKTAASFGAVNYTVHPPSVASYANIILDKLADNMMVGFEKLLTLTEDTGMTISLENGFSRCCGSYTAKIAERFNSERLGLCFDSGHANYGKEGLDISFESMKPYIITAHLHDNDSKSDQHLLPGKGNIDWNMLVKKLKQCPRLVMVESEANMHGAGQGLFEIAEACSVFNNLWNSEV